jgi:hypothetical protein
MLWRVAGRPQCGQFHPFALTNIGAAFMHQDGDGFNIVLQALPINGKIVLRLPKTDDKDDPERAKQTIREENDRRKSTRRDK